MGTVPDRRGGPGVAGGSGSGMAGRPPAADAGLTEAALALAPESVSANVQGLRSLKRKWEPARQAGKQRREAALARRDAAP